MIVKNSYKPSNLPFVPYVYYIKHIPTGIWYIGSKYAKSAHPSTFLKTYFTSSKIIKSLLATSTMNDIEFKILKTFTTIHDTTSYERRLIQKTNAIENHMSANLNNNQDASKTIQCNFKTKLISNIETKTCIRVKFDMPVPDGWYEGNINNKNKLKTWYLWWHNPITLESTMLPPVMLPPPNWVWGRPKEHSNSVNLKNTRIWICNGKIDKLVKKDIPIPDGFRLGKLRKIEITDGINNKLIYENEIIPNGWYIGKTNIQKEKFTDKRTFITNGSVKKWIPHGTPIPEGWILLVEYAASKPPVCAYPQPEMIYINNGKVNKLHRKISTIPEGWVLGHYKSTTQPKQIKFKTIINKITGEAKTIQYGEPLPDEWKHNCRCFVKGDQAPNKGRITYIHPTTLVKRVLNPTDIPPEGFITLTMFNKLKRITN